ncbi:universal stress protein [Xanthovirga aplysinae]|uniref:universal stress protein n=1 Tax=Xanthovirga aplysinae TaxID=2529853 RepID=UPI0012BB5BA6|nr:universal stress protein [Xanthovirga aplysinae]MTI33206.1 hypothetical protein [Xanthovirga aplysinae]
MNKILVPLDFSDVSINGLEVAVKFAGQMNAELFLFHTIAEPGSFGFSTTGSGDGSGSSGDRFIAELYRQSLRSLRKIMEYYGNENVLFRPSIIISDFKTGISDFVEKYQIDLVIMGTSGVSTLTEYFEGNHTEQVIRNVNCPVIAVKEQQKNFRMRNMVISTDMSMYSDAYISYLRDIANYFEAKIHLIKISSIKNQQRNENSLLNDWAIKHNLINYSVQTLFSKNRESSLIEFAHRKNADLIAVVGKGRKSRFPILGSSSFSEEVIKKSRVPVLSLELRPGH